jgi:predicted murein hydrolase (TIGR00659 family)
MTRVSDLWVYLAASPLLWLSITLIAYGIAVRIFDALNQAPVINPLVTAVAMVIAIVLITRTPYETYFEGAQFVHFLLGPATVALAIPLVENLGRVRRALVPIALALVAGSLTAVVSAVGVAALLGAPRDVFLSIAPKSVTAPVAMAISDGIGGIPSLTAVLVIFTGIAGAIVVTPLFNALGVRDYAARGFAAGLAAHGLGTARAFQVSEVAGVFAGLAMVLNGMLTSLLLPLVAAALPH